MTPITFKINYQQASRDNILMHYLAHSSFIPNPITAPCYHFLIPQKTLEQLIQENFADPNNRVYQSTNPSTQELLDLANSLATEGTKAQFGGYATNSSREDYGIYIYKIEFTSPLNFNTNQLSAIKEVIEKADEFYLDTYFFTATWE